MRGGPSFNRPLPNNHADSAATGTIKYFNFRETDWELFREKLEPRLRKSPDYPVITSTDQLNMAINDLTQDLQETILEVVK